MSDHPRHGQQRRGVEPGRNQRRRGQPRVVTLDETRGTAPDLTQLSYGQCKEFTTPRRSVRGPDFRPHRRRAFRRQHRRRRTRAAEATGTSPATATRCYAVPIAGASARSRPRTRATRTSTCPLDHRPGGVGRPVRRSPGYELADAPGRRVLARLRADAGPATRTTTSPALAIVAEPPTSSPSIRHASCPGATPVATWSSSRLEPRVAAGPTS